MNQFISFIKKEFLHIIRDVRTMLILLAMPVVQLIIFGFAITTEINHIPFVVMDESKTVESTQLIEKFGENNYFDLHNYMYSARDIEAEFQKGKAKLAIVISPSFSTDLYHTGKGNIQLIIDASDPNEGSTISGYAQQIIMQYQQSLLNGNKAPYTIQVEQKMLYNPQMLSAYNFVPGIMGLILMLICAMMTSLSIVGEKEKGTMEILLVSPVKPTTIIFAKAIPYLVVSMIDVVSILLLSYFVLHVPIAGNLFVIFFLSTLFTFSALSLGLLISSIVKTQQVAMMISAVGLMLPTMLLSGLIYPIENMPLPLQVVSNAIPARWFISAIKDVMIKGLGFDAIWQECLILLGITCVLLFASIKRFKHRL